MSDLEAHHDSLHREKSREHTTVIDTGTGETHLVDISDSYVGTLGKISRWLESFGVESRGFQRVLPEERTKQSYWGLCLIWASAGLTISGFTTGMIGPLYYNLTFGQTAGIIWGLGGLGAMSSAYLAIYGKKNGLRALVNSRYAFGYYGAMLMSLLNILTELCFGIVACILGGETLNTMSAGKLSTVGGIIIIGIISWFIATAGFKYVHHYERVAWILPAIVFVSLYAVGASQFTNMPSPNPEEFVTQSGLALSFAAIAFSGGSGWVAVSADYYIYFPESTPDWNIFLINFLGLWIIPSFASTCGAGFGSALWQNAEWLAAYTDAGETSAGLIEYVLRPLGDVRFFFLFILAFSMMSNNVFNLYSVSISMQMFGKYPAMIPRFVYTFLVTVIMIVISCVGYDSLNAIISNLGAVIAYWTIIFFAIILEEAIIFRRSRGWNLEGWDDPKLLPAGYAAMLAFWIGVAGSIVGMGQTWYIGPIAKLIGDSGGDIGTELGFVFAAISYPGLRWLELKRMGR